MTANAQSIRNKRDEFETFVELKKPMIISITESWGKEWINDGAFALKGYTMYRDDRKVKVGGGTLLYISNKIEQRACRPLNATEVESSVWCWIVENTGKKTLVGSIYRSTTSTKANNKLLLDEIAKANDIAGDNRLLILGDLNVPYINWSNRELTDKARDIEVYTLDVINDCFLYQHVDKLT